MSEPAALARLLERQPVAILDGGLATELQARGADLDDPLWSARLLADQPALIEQVHHDYFAAGADLSISASYQASFAGFAARGIAHDAAATLMRRSVELACAARDRFWGRQQLPDGPGRARPLVAASIGPYGASLADGSEYRGDYDLDEDALFAFHRERFEVLANAGADLLACETIPCLAEARALARLFAAHPGAGGWISFSCRDALHVSSGERYADCVAALQGCAGLCAVGVNCSSPGDIAGLLDAARPHTRLPFVVYPNSGERYDAVQRCWGGTRLPLVTLAPEWVARGARLVGGCCRTAPPDITALRERLLAERAP